MSSPSQLFSCVESAAILKSPLNRSTAKNHWSFSKDSRFKIPKFYCDTFYQIPETKSSRKAGFGYGKKADLQFNKHRYNVVPASNSYNIKSFVETDVIHNKGFTALFSREEIAPMSYIDIEPQKMPGPGRYEQFRYNESPKWSLRPRINSELFARTSQKIVPGPGSYQDKEAISPVGNYFLSNHTNSKAKVFNPRSSARFFKSFTDAPGAGTYQPNDKMPADGTYVESKNKSVRKRAFLMGRRSSFVEDMPKRVLTPGPGTYRLPSDFGHYDEIQKSRNVLFSKNTSRTKDQ